jgi:transcriptional regulator with XRE-family HTH domain
MTARAALLRILDQTTIAHESLKEETKMAKRGDPKSLRYVVLVLRSHAGMSQEVFGKEIRVDQAEISRFELGQKAPSEELQLRMAKAADVPWSVVVHLRRFFIKLVTLLDGWGAGEVTPDFDRAIVEAVVLALEPYLMGLGKAEPVRQTPEEALREAEEVWPALEAFPAAKIRRLIELAPRASRNWALALRINDASVKAAADGRDEALELADLADFIAKRASEALLT